MSFTDAEKRKECLREVKMRKRVYARSVEQGKMKQSDASRYIDLMQAIADDYASQDLFDAPEQGSET